MDQLERSSGGNRETSPPGPFNPQPPVRIDVEFSGFLEILVAEGRNLRARNVAVNFLGIPMDSRSIPAGVCGMVEIQENRNAHAR